MKRTSPPGILSVALIDGASASEATTEQNPSETSRRTGRPLKLTPHVVKTVCQMVRDGNYLKIACAAAGISADTLEAWRKRGNNGEEPYADFARQLAAAELAAETTLVKIWHDAAPEDWRAARDLLARRFPERWEREAEVVNAQITPDYCVVIHLDEIGGPREKPAIEVAALPTPRKPDDPNSSLN